MKNETEEMRAARHELQLLSASDPAARANILRHVAAFALMIAGRRERDRLDGEAHFGAGFEFTDGERALFGSLTRRDRAERFYISFDVDDAAGAPLSLGLFRAEGDNLVFYPRCVLWSPAGDGRALVVPTGVDGYGGHFAFRRGRPLRSIAAPLPGDFEAGVRRANSRFARLLKSEQLRHADRGGFVSVVRNEGAELLVGTVKIAA